MFISWKDWNWLLALGSLLIIDGAISASINCALAQPIADDTLAKNSIVKPSIIPLNKDVSSILIDGGVRRGANLLHSFKEFNIGEKEGVYFINPMGIKNILSRVTGDKGSEILGTLGVLGNANLFLINPNGIIFGPNASLSLNGSFVGTTANAIGLANGDIFSANPVKNLPTGLLNVNPSAFFFNQIAAPIQNNSANLKVKNNRSLLLMGGNVRIDGGSLNAFGGRVELGGLAQEGTVDLNISDDNFSLNFPAHIAPADVSLTNGAEVNVASNGGGSIAIHAQNIDILDRSSLRAGISLLAGIDDAQAGDIMLSAKGALTVKIALFTMLFLIGGMAVIYLLTQEN
ncbi:filamentous hemagglutinin N-terminal domain-containing protein [Nostoc sp. ChiSLP03a]|uniref:filamentous hemagglutinin N-terminal domain-containing protein n=1 Tax=Nostoc sp. ChiSLP03a TaxID=3075380 RepID=UPI002AD46A4E|nr:filamentous hemagglutinin N-terminal domain-containing protein [Nostoc sp. ChiSLP03a]MDZ8211209.1 filamentous hemagglutinin N-terminal domain-containing protein [Nostoc sp. ChiSLP03a]